MKDIGRTLLLSMWISGLVLAFGCGDDTSSPPLAPSPPAVADRGQQAAVNHDPAAAWNDGVGGPASASSVDRATVGLKSTAPEPRSPIGDAEIDDQTPVLTASKATGVYGTADFEHEFALFKSTGGNQAEVERSHGTSQGAGVTSYRVRKRLDSASSYLWRVRAVSGGEYGPWSADARFRIAVAVRLGTPRPLSPINDATTTTLRPVFKVRNGAVEGHTGAADIRLEVASDADFMTIVGRAQKAAQAGGETDMQLSNALMRATRYYWRVRALLASPEVTSGWSATQRFRTPGTTAFTPGGSPNAPFTTGGGNPRNMVGVVQDIARRYPRTLRNSCQEHGGSWEFMDRVVEDLRKIDGRWGYNCKRGDCNTVSHDVVNYYRGSGTSRAAANNSTAVSIIDVIANHCTPNPRPAWTDLTRATRDAGAIGRWKYPR